MRTNSSGISLTLCGREPSPQVREIAHGPRCWGLLGMPTPAQTLRESNHTESEDLAEEEDKVRAESHLTGCA